MTGLLLTYLVVGGVYFFVAVLNAGYVRHTIYVYPDLYWPGEAEQDRAVSALMVFLTPVWPVIVIASVVIAVWSLVQDVRSYYCNTNRKGDDR